MAEVPKSYRRLEGSETRLAKDAKFLRTPPVRLSRESGCDISRRIGESLRFACLHGAALLLLAGVTANAQFKEVGPAPFSPPIARQKIRALLDGVDSGNRRETVETLSGLLVWYRDLLDEELIAAWQNEPKQRANLTAVIGPLGDPRVASAIIEFSWRQQRPETFTLAYAPMLGNLMVRYPESAKPFLDDLLGPALDLPEPQAEAVCRIFLDTPDTGAWKQRALQILPHYRRTAENLLAQDLAGDEEKHFRARVWLADLKWDSSAVARQETSRGQPRLFPPPSEDHAPASQPGGKPTLARRTGVDPLPPVVPANSAVAPASPPQPYGGPRSGTLECRGGSVPQNAEYVFRNLPPVQMQLDYDRKVWDATLAPAEGQTQKLVLRNKSSSPQKRCIVHWSVSP